MAKAEVYYFVQIENAMYPVNVEALNTVFSPYGFVQKIAIFEKNGQTQVSHALTKTALHGELPAVQKLLATCKLWGESTPELFNALQALIQYPDPTSAGSAKQALEGHAIYEGGCNKVQTIYGCIHVVFLLNECNAEGMHAESPSVCMQQKIISLRAAHVADLHLCLCSSKSVTLCTRT